MTSAASPTARSARGDRPAGRADERPDCRAGRFRRVGTMASTSDRWAVDVACVVYAFTRAR
jgi:hypothetical protein